MRPFVLAAVAVLFLNCSTQAAIIHVDSIAAHILNQDFTPVESAALKSFDPRVGAEIYASEGHFVVQVDVYLRITNLGPSELGFGNIGFDIALTGDLHRNDDIRDFQCGGDIVDFNGPLVAGGMAPKFAECGDFGLPGDLQEIIVGIASPELFGPIGVDPRRRLGQSPEGDFVGSLYLDLAATEATSGGVEIIPIAGSTYDVDGNLTTRGVVVVGGALAFRIASDVVQIGDTNGDELVDLSDLNNVRNNFGGTGLGDTNGDDIVDLVDLNNVRNNFGTNVAVTVPEPSGAAILSASVLAIAGRARRAFQKRCAWLTGNVTTRLGMSLIMASLIMGAVKSHADVYRWDNGQVIAGTQGVTPGPGVYLSFRKS